MISLSIISLAAISTPITAQTTGAPTAGPLTPFEPSRLPSLGEPDSGELTEGGERRIGDLIMRQVRRDSSYLDDPQLLDHLRALWRPLVQAGRNRGEIVPELDSAFAWETFLIRDPSINAFALPGGYVGVHLGLMAQAATRDELAAVLAHELVHVTQRHIARSNSSARRQSTLGMVAMLLGVLAASRAGSPDLAQASIMGSQAAMAQGQLNFSRDMEREADRIGLSIMTEAGYSPLGVAAVFERLDKASRLNDSGNFPYLRSHPLTVERIGEARARVQSLQQATGTADQTVVVTGRFLDGALPPVELHQLMRARARVLMEPSVTALRRWQQLARDTAEGDDRAAALYAAALASTLLREPAAAKGHLQALLQLPHSPSVRTTLDLLTAEVALVAREPARALGLLESLDGRQRPVRLMRLEAALRWAQLARDSGERVLALQALKLHADAVATWVIDHRSDALAWSQLATASQALDQPLRAVRAEAESRWALGDLNGALDRLKAGQRLARTTQRTDHIEASVIDSRLRDLERERRRAFADMRGVREEDLPPVLPPNVPLLTERPKRL